MSIFNEETIQAVWNKAHRVNGNDPNIYRKDYAGAWIRRDQYGKETEYGWEIDHLKPISKGGTDDIINLMPLQWQNNRHKSDDYPEFHTSISSQNVHNIMLEQAWKAK